MLSSLWSVVKRVGPPIATGALLFLLFFNPIIFLGNLLAGFLADGIADLILRPLSDLRPEQSAAYYNKRSVIFATVGPIVGLAFAVGIIAAGWWISSLGTTLAYSLGYRSQIEPRRSLSTAAASAVHAEGEPLKDLPGVSQDIGGKPLLGIQNARSRLESHITSLRNASIVNLFVGISIAILGIWVLSTVFVDVEKFGGTTERKVGATDFLVFSLLPRVSATLFIQVFAYFFLLMYRSNQADIRYFQNEMSNLDAISTGVALALRPEISATQKTVVSMLLKTERNRVMSKNQRVINPADDEDLYQKLLREMNQSIAKLSAHRKDN